jgi:glutamate/tyrosine decarboxylase-like PLP-dependent enzyme
LGVKRGLPVHVDACLGGFLLPFIEKLDALTTPENIDLFDFRVPGVTSISADAHKYGYAAKGASVILYSNVKYLRHQFSAATDWCGGVYASPTLAGTRPGGAIAAAWASLHAIGEEGFVENARNLMDVSHKFRERINAIPMLRVLGNPSMSVMAFAAREKGFSIYAVGDILETKRWHIDRLQRPESLHLILNPGHGEVIDEFFTDLRDAVEYVQAHPESAFEGSAPMYGLIAKIPLRRLVKSQVLAIIEKMYSEEGGVPELDAQELTGAESKLETRSSVPGLAIIAMRLRARLARALRGSTRLAG